MICERMAEVFLTFIFKKGKDKFFEMMPVFLSSKRKSDKLSQ